MTNNLLTRYQQSRQFIQGVLSNKVVLNDAVFPHWIQGSHCFWYGRETKQGDEYRLVDAAAASNSAAFDHYGLAKSLEVASGREVDATNLPISVLDITLSPKQVYFSAFEENWVFEQETLCCKEIDPSPLDDELLSPNGQYIAFVRDHNLWVKDLVSGEERALTQDGVSDAPYATAPSFGLGSGLQALWSPDSNSLLTHQLDMRGVASRPMVHHVPEDGSIRPQLVEYKAAYPGDKVVETLRLVSIDVDSGAVQAADYANLSVCRWGAGYLTQEKFGWWSHDNRRAFFVDVSRGAKAVRVVEFDTKTGATRVLFEETSDTFVKLSQDIVELPLFCPIANIDELIWFSERSGWGHLYLYDLNTGELKRPLTEGEWLVRGIAHIDAEQRTMLIQTAGRDRAISPYYRDICAVDLDKGTIQPLAYGADDFAVYGPQSGQVQARYAYGLDTPGVNGISPDGDYVVATRSRVDKPPISLLMDRNGVEILTIEKADPYALPADFEWPEPIKLTAADGITDLYGVVYRPPGFSTGENLSGARFFIRSPWLLLSAS